MATYLKLFENSNDYNSFTQTDAFIKPNVSLCMEENKVHYNPLDPPAIWGTVDLGLPSGTLWATMNVGATSETDYGLYFAWGDTQGYTASQVGTGSGQKAFTWNDYVYGTENNLTKYNPTDGLATLELTDDAAYALSNGQYVIPTKEQFEELIANTTHEWHTVMLGNIFTSTVNGNSLFFPTPGNCVNGSVADVSSYGTYLTNSISTSDVKRSILMVFEYGDVFFDNYRRYCGSSIRGVLKQG